MLHFRTQFRNGAVDRLKAKLTRVKPEKVFNARPGHPAPSEAPCVNVHTLADDPGLQERGRGRTQRRVTTFVITAYVRDTENAASELDALCMEIEQVLGLPVVDENGVEQGAWTAIHPALEDFSYAGTRPLADQGEIQNGVADLTFLASTFVKPGAPEAPMGA